MDGEVLDLPPKLKKVNRECCAWRVVDGGVDRISQLPDEILLLILSSLSLRRAVATSVLSSRWSDLWKHVPCLDFDPYDWGMDDRRWLNEIVNSVIQSHKALSLRRFRILSRIDNRPTTSVVTRWLEFVFSRRVESLELDLLPRDGGTVVFEESLSRICGAPHTLPFCQSLKRLSLRNLIVQLFEANLKPYTSEFAVQHIALINRLPVLKLTVTLYKMLFTDVFSHLPNLKKLWICCFVRAGNHSLLRVADLIWASPRLENFKFKVLTTPADDFSALMEDITNVDRSPHQHLRVFKFKTYSQPTDQLVELATCISDNCIALRKMSIGRRVREQSHWDNIKQQVQGKVRSQIQLRFYSL